MKVVKKSEEEQGIKKLCLVQFILKREKKGYVIYTYRFKKVNCEKSEVKS
jgi:hypothetical protein